METIQFIELLILLLLIGFFSGTTIAFQHINRFSMEIKRKKGWLSGRILFQYKNNPVRYVASSVIGVLICSIVFGILLDYTITPFWEQIPFGDFNSVYLKIIALSLITIILFFPFILFARSHYRAQANRLLPVFSFLITFFNKILYPIISFMTGLANWMLQYLFNINITKEGLPFDIAKDGSLIYNADKDEATPKGTSTQFFEKALNFPQIKIRNCLTPRKEIQAIDSNFTREMLKDKILSSNHSRIIIFDNSIDNIIGFIHQLDLFREDDSHLHKLIRPISVVPETMNIISLLTMMTKEHKNIVRVVDEYGGTAGIITIEDLLEEIFGDISERGETNQLIDRQIAEKEFLFSGRMELDFLSEKYAFHFNDTDTETLSGYIIAMHESIPKEDELLIIGNFEFDIVNVTDTRIEMVKMRVLG